MHHNLKPSVHCAEIQVNTRVRQISKSIAKFVAELHRLSEFCEFGETLNDMPRDRLVCGVEDRQIQRYLLCEPELTLRE